jgi:hypothetical protein
MTSDVEKRCEELIAAIDEVSHEAASRYRVRFAVILYNRRTDYEESDRRNPAEIVLCYQGRFQELANEMAQFPLLVKS